MKNDIQAIIYDWDGVILNAASRVGSQFVDVLIGIIEKDKFVNCNVFSSKTIPSIVELSKLLESDFNG